MDNNILDYNLTPKEEKEFIPRYAGFWTRVVASFLDGLILLPLATFAVFALTYFKSIPLYILASTISAAYKPICEYKLGATLGKMAINLKVVNENFQGISVEQTLTRSAIFLIGSVTSIILIFLIDTELFYDVNGFFEFEAVLDASQYNWINNLSTLPVLISCIVVGFDARKQGLHDKLAKTFCIHTD